MALSSGTFSQVGGAVADLYTAQSQRTSAAGNRIQAQEYDLAAQLSLQNEQFTETSTAIKQQQQQRSFESISGQQSAGVAASGFEASGSSLDILRDSAAQGALAKETLGQQGLIDEAGYKEQAQSYQLMSQSARMAADAQDKAAEGSTLSSIIKWGSVAASAVATVYSGGAAAPLLATSIANATSGPDQ